MAAPKFGPEEHDRDDGDCMAQIQELQAQLKRLCRQSIAADRAVQLAASGVEFDGIMAFNLATQPASHDGV